jgi:hypothetical protein
VGEEPSRRPPGRRALDGEQEQRRTVCVRQKQCEEAEGLGDKGNCLIKERKVHSVGPWGPAPWCGTD